MIIYDYKFFHKLLLRMKSKPHSEEAQHLTEKDVFIRTLNEKKISDYDNIDWRWLRGDLIGEEVSNAINDEGDTGSSFTDLKIEEFINKITSREVRIKVLEYLRDNCRECLFNKWFFESDICSFETECARLISREYENGEHMEESTPQQPASEPMTDIVQLMQDINAGKISYKDVDWVTQIKTILKLCNLMPTKYPYVIWLWGFLGEIDTINTRIDILHKFQEIAPQCFDDLDQRIEFINDCDCIIYIYRSAIQYNLRDDIKVRTNWTDDRKFLNDLAHILCKEMVDPKFMVAMAEEMHRTVVELQQKRSMMEIILKSSRNIDKLTIDNIVEFAKQLYIAEGFRHLILSGQEDSIDIPALEDFEPKLLKACFEEYIRLRSLQIKEIIESDLTHYGDADELECWEYLLEDECQYIDQENGLEAFRGSPAYNAMWYPGKQKIREMINVFSEYLKNKIKSKKKEVAAKQGVTSIVAQTVNIHENHGHITNVENNGD